MEDNPGAQVYTIKNNKLISPNGTTASVTGITTKFYIKAGPSNRTGHALTNDKLEIEGATWTRFTPSADLFQEESTAAGSYNANAGYVNPGKNFSADIAIPTPGEEVKLSLGVTKGVPEVCLEANITYEPLDMTSYPPTEEDNITMCKLRCMGIVECAHFAYWIPGKSCHVQDVFSVRTTGRLLFVSGPPGCKIDGGRNLNTSMIVQQNHACFAENTTYSPADSRFNEKDPIKNATFSSVLECQEGCANRSWCAGFTYNGLAKTCHFADKDAELLKGVAYSVTGHPRCKGSATFSFAINNISHEMLTEKKATKDFVEAVKFGIANVKRLMFMHDPNVTMQNLTDAYEDGVIVEPLSDTTVDLSGNATVTHVTVHIGIAQTSHATSVQELLLQKRDWLTYSVLMSIKRRFDGSQKIAVGVVSMGNISGISLVSPEERAGQSFRSIIMHAVRKDLEPRQQGLPIESSASWGHSLRNLCLAGTILAAAGLFAARIRGLSRGHTIRGLSVQCLDKDLEGSYQHVEPMLLEEAD